jgi:hypothetical protein
MCALAIALAAIGATPLVSHASQIFYEGFDYPTGLLNPAGTGSDNFNSTVATPAGPDEWNNATTIGATAISVVSGNLTSPVGASTGNKASINNPATAGIERLNFNAVSSGSVFYSLVLQATTVTGINNTTTGAYFAGLSSFGEGGGDLPAPPANGNIGVRLAIRGDAGNSANFQVGLSNTVAQAVGNYASDSFAINTPIFVIAEYRFDAGGNDTGRLWLNPNPATFDPNVTAASVTVSQADIGGPIGSFFLRQTGGLPNTVEVDEIRVGTAYTDVVPEPTAVAAFGVLGASMLVRRQRRH